MPEFSSDRDITNTTPDPKKIRKSLQTMSSETDAFNETYNEATPRSLENLISIYPVSSTIATHLPAGDLISLSRSSKTLRFHTHAFSDTPPSLPFGSQPRSTTNPPSTSSSENLHIGSHQTRQWSNLKSLSPFTCSFPSHKDPKSADTKANPTHPCKFCSRPICKTCIVRSFFTDPKSSKLTYKYRARHLCPKCWATGNLRKDYRFPLGECVSREQIWKGRGYAQRGNWCGCSASEDNWVCGSCRGLQNRGGYLNLGLADVSREDTGGDDMKMQQSAPAPGEFVAVQCYGLDCDAVIDQVDRDRRRICLWCSKPLMRPYGGDDRLRWEEKQIEIRAAAAASRSADIYEWARNRFRNLTMSRREMRGTEACVRLTGSDGPEHDKPIFVRHLDTINYRKYMSERSAPSGDCVYQSKHGRWTYSRQFLTRFDRCTDPEDRANVFPLPAGTDVKALFLLNMEIGLPGARTNSSPHFHRSSGACATILRYGTQLQNAGLLDQECLSWLLLSPNLSRDGMISLRDKIFSYLEVWENLSEEDQVSWTPPSFWDLASEAGVLQRGENPDDEPLEKKRLNLRVVHKNAKTNTRDFRATAEAGNPEDDEDTSEDDEAGKTGNAFSGNGEEESEDVESDGEPVYDDHAAAQDDIEVTHDDGMGRSGGGGQQGTRNAEA